MGDGGSGMAMAMLSAISLSMISSAAAATCCLLLAGPKSKAAKDNELTAAGKPGAAKAGGGQAAGSSAAGSSTSTAAGSSAAAQNANVSCPSGQLPNAKGACVPMGVLSGEFGGKGGGSRKWGNCMPGHYVAGINVGYDDKFHELKYFAWGCTDGQTWTEGREAPSNVGSTLISFATMGAYAGSSTGAYDGQTWANPHNGGAGWNQVGYALANESQKVTANRVRAFGPDTAHLFGSGNVNKVSDVTKQKGESKLKDGEKLTWRCDSAGEAPVGKMWAVSGLGVRSGTAVDSVQFKCSLIDAE